MLGRPNPSRPPGQGPGEKQQTQLLRGLSAPPRPAPHPAASLAPALPPPGALSPPPFLLPNHITCSFAIFTLSSDSLSGNLLRHKPGQPLPPSPASSPWPRPYNTLGMAVSAMDFLLFLMLFGWGGWEWVGVTASSCRCSSAPGFLTWPEVAARAVRWLNQQQRNHPQG